MGGGGGGGWGEEATVPNLQIFNDLYTARICWDEKKSKLGNGSQG